MCGIVGTMSFKGLDSKDEKVRQEAIIFLMTELLYMTHTRGKDATGISALFGDGNYLGLKMGVPSPEFISRFGDKETDYDGFLKVIRKTRSPVKTLIGHCRKLSVGRADDNVNNHPIKVGNIVGIHNGTLTNHEKIFEKLKCGRDGEVDSEAIMRLLHFYTKGGKEPFTAELVKEVCLRLQGTYSCMAFNGDNPNQVTMFRDTRPAEIALIRPLSLVIVASEKDFLKEVLVRFNKMAKLYQTSVKYPFLTKDDVLLKTMPDDSVAVFDLKRTVTAETDVEDLFDGEKIPRTGRLWRSTVKSTNYYQGNQNRGVHGNRNANVADKKTHTAQGVKKTEVGAKAANAGSASEDDEGTSGITGNQNSSTTGDTDSSDRAGRVWSKEKKGYTKVDGIPETKKIGGVQINLNDHKITTVYGGEAKNEDEVVTLELEEDEVVILDDPADNEGKKKSCGVGMEPVSMDKINTAFGDPAVLETPDFVPDKNDKLIEHLSKTATEVEVGLNPEALKHAVEAAAVMPKYENEEELLDDLDVSHPTVFRNAPLHALANRIGKLIYKHAYYAGWMDRKDTELPVNTERLTEKKTKAQANVRKLKLMVRILSGAVHLSTGVFATKRRYITDAVKSEQKKGNDLTPEDIDTLFSIGDVRDYNEIRQVKLAVLEQEKGEGDG